MPSLVDYEIKFMSLTITGFVKLTFQKITQAVQESEFKPKAGF